MYKPLVSIIIPVFNGEGSVATAIESAVNQSYSNIEVIIVDDGSTDNSSLIIDEYAKKDKRIHCFKQLNRGQSSARNTGLSNSKGDFIQFLDCDDFLDVDAIDILIQEIKNYDSISFCLYGFNVYRKGILLRTPNPGVTIFRFGDKYEKFINIEKLINSPCNKLYSKKYISNKFDEKLKYGEDEKFNYDNLTNDVFIVTTDKCLYNVCLNVEGSVNKRYKLGRLLDILIIGMCKENKMLQMFIGDYDINKHYVGVLSNLEIGLEYCAVSLNYNDFKKEIINLRNEDYFWRICSNLKNTKIFMKISYFFLNNKLNYIEYFYLKFLFKKRKNKE